MTHTTTPVLDFSQLPWPKTLPTHAVFDVDGTLTDEHSITAPQTLVALRDLHTAGIPVTLATGRIHSAGQTILDKAGIPGWVVGGAGGTVARDGLIVRQHHMPANLVNQALERGRELGLSCYFYLDDEIIMDSQAEHSPALLTNANEGIPVARADLATMDFSQVVKVTYSGPKARIDELLPVLSAEFDGLVRGHPMFLDLPLPGITKWNGIQEALADQGLRAVDGIGVGDSGNDVPWLPNIGFPLAAPASPPEVLAVCRWVLPVGPHPVASLIQAILDR